MSDKKVCIGYSGKFTSLSCKKENKQQKKLPKKIQHFIGNLVKTSFAYRFLSTLRCGGESPRQFQRNQAMGMSREKPQEQHLVKDKGNAFGYTTGF